MVRFFFQRSLAELRTRIQEGIRDSRGFFFFGFEIYFFRLFLDVFLGARIQLPGSPTATTVFVKDLSAEHSQTGYCVQRRRQTTAR